MDDAIWIDDAAPARGKHHVWHTIVNALVHWKGTLKMRLTLAAIAALTAGIGSITFILLQRAEHGTLAQAHQRELTDTVRVADALSHRIVALQKMLGATGAAIDPTLEPLDTAMERHLRALPALRQNFANLFLAAPDGRMRAYIDDAGARQPQVNLADRDYFRRTLAERRAIISDPVPDRVSGEPVVVFTQPIVRDCRVTSVLGGAVRLASRDLAVDLIEGSDANEDALVVITDRTGRIIAHPTRDLMLKPLTGEPRFDKAFEAWVRGGSATEPAGHELHQPGEVVTVAAVAGTDWMVWRALPEAVLLMPLRRARGESLRWAGAVIALLAVGILAIVTWLLRPLTQLEQRASHLFDPAHEVHAGWPDEQGEIGRLARVLRHVSAERAQLEGFNAQVLGKLASVMAAAPLGIAFTRDQRFELVSAAWCALFKREEQELLGQPVAAIFSSDDDHALLGPLVDAAFAQDGHYEGEWQLSRRDGSTFWGQLCGRPVSATERDAGTIWTLADVSRHRSTRQDLEWSATHDPLTGLANRKGFEIRLNQVFGKAPAALIVLDLDHFKPINDRHGHAAGDAVLKAVASAITSHVRSRDLAVRTGGDEFAVLLENCPADAALRVATELLRAVSSATVPWRGESLGVGASVGVSSLVDSMATVEAWIESADAACYAAKAAGRNTVRASGPPVLQLVNAG